MPRSFRILLCLSATALVACDGDPPPLAPAAAAPTAAPATAASTAQAASVQLDPPQLADRLLDARPDPQTRAAALAQVDATVAAVLNAAASGTPAQQGRTPGALLDLGTAAWPGLCTALAHRDPVQRRLAALSLLQFRDQLHTADGALAVRTALAAARDDADLGVRAAAEHAWRFATGDTTALDASRAADEAARRLGR